MIYGTGRSGGPPNAEPQLYAVDKATGKQVGAVAIPSRTSAVPMTFMHKGQQYIVFATGAGANTSLVALTLPKAGGGDGWGRRGGGGGMRGRGEGGGGGGRGVGGGGWGRGEQAF